MTSYEEQVQQEGSLVRGFFGDTADPGHASSFTVGETSNVDANQEEVAGIHRSEKLCETPATYKKEVAERQEIERLERKLSKARDLIEKLQQGAAIPMDANDRRELVSYKKLASKYRYEFETLWAALEAGGEQGVPSFSRERVAVEAENKHLLGVLEFSEHCRECDEDYIAHLKKLSDEDRERIKEYEAYFSALSEEKEVDAGMLGLKIQNETLEQEVEELNGLLETYRMQFEEKVSSMQAQIEFLVQTCPPQLEAENARLRDENAKLEDRNKRLKANRTVIMEENAKLTQENAKLKAENAAKRMSEDTKLQAENAKLKAENANLRSGHVLSVQRGKIAELKAENAKLRAVLDQLGATDENAKKRPLLLVEERASSSVKKMKMGKEAGSGA
jgi:cell division protein FtsB